MFGFQSRITSFNLIWKTKQKPNNSFVALRNKRRRARIYKLFIIYTATLALNWIFKQSAKLRNNKIDDEVRRTQNIFIHLLVRSSGDELQMIYLIASFKFGEKISSPQHFLWLFVLSRVMSSTEHIITLREGGHVHTWHGTEHTDIESIIGSKNLKTFCKD